MSRIDKFVKTIKGFSLSELLDLDYALREEIERRQEQGEMDIPVKAGRQVVTEQKESGQTYRQELVKCGKPGCKCATGELHGPYWYRYWKEDGKSKSEYIGKRRK